jgi:phage-related protein
MPITQPAGTELFLSKQGGMFVPVILLDIQTLDGSQYFFTDYEGSYPTKFTGATQFYNGWIKSGCNFTCTRDMSSNAGDLTLQNISGNTIDRDVSAALKNHEFEGAYAVTRLWVPLLDVAIREFHCSLTEQNPKEDEASFRELQLFDPTQYVLAGDVQVETCTWRFKSLQCGSTGTAVSCPKNLPACQDATRAAQERFNAILTTVPNTVNVPITSLIDTPDPRNRGGGGNRGPFPFA